MLKYATFITLSLSLLSQGNQASIYDNESGTIGEMLGDETLRNSRKTYTEAFDVATAPHQSNASKTVSDPLRTEEYWFGEKR